MIVEGQSAAVRTEADEALRFRVEVDEHELSIRLSHDEDVATLKYTHAHHPSRTRRHRRAQHVHVALHTSKLSSSCR